MAAKSILFQAAIAMLIVVIVMGSVPTYAATSTTVAASSPMSSTQTDEVLLVRLLIGLNINPYSIHRSQTDRAFDSLWTTLVKQTACGSPARYSLDKFDSTHAIWLVYFDTPDAATRQICNLSLMTQAADIRSEVNRDPVFIQTSLVITSLSGSVEPRPTHCFNGIKDEGEINTDCGYTACNIKCNEKQTCRRGEDCVQECFASICQFYSNTQSLSLFAVASLAAFAFFML